MANNTLATLKNEINLIDGEYTKFFNKYNKIFADTKSIMQTFFAELLKAGSFVIDKKYHKDNTCPLCLQGKDIVKLNTEIKQRLEEINKSAQLKTQFESAKKSIFSISSERIKRIEVILNNPIISEPANTKIKQSFENLKIKFQNYQKETEKKILNGDTIANPNDLLIIDKDFEIQSEILKDLELITNAIKK